MNTITYLANVVESDPNNHWLDCTNESTIQVNVSESREPGQRPGSPVRIEEKSLSGSHESYTLEFESPPELDEDCQSSDISFSVGNEFATSALRTLKIHNCTHLDKVELDVALIDRIQMESSSSCDGISTYPSHVARAHNEHDLCWNVVRPLDARNTIDTMPPPIPAKNPRRLLSSIGGDSSDGSPEAARRSKNIRNLYLDLSKSNTKHVEESPQTFISNPRQPYPVLTKRTEGPAQIPMVSPMQLPWLSSEIREATGAKETRFTKASVPARIGNCCSVENKSEVRRSRHLASPKHILKWIQDLDGPPNAQGHKRSVSESTGLNHGRVRVLSRWDEAMPPYHAIKHFSSARSLKCMDPSRFSQTLNINKSLPPLPPLPTEP